jgi:hypothetical protein
VFGSEREAYWRGVVAGCEASGKSIAGYCRDEGLSVSKYHWWRRELKQCESVYRSGAMNRILPVETRLWT